MKAIRSLRVIERCVILVLFLCLANVAVFSQTVSPVYKPPYPIIGPYAAPLIRIISPANHAIFVAPVNIPVVAYVRELSFVNDYTNVELYAGTNDLGAGHRLSTYPSLPDPGVGGGLLPTPILEPEYFVVWTNPPPGVYALTAVARSLNLSVTSAPVSITVVTSTVLPPPNQEAMVSVVATDPIAIAGTNCWISLGTTNSVPAWTNWPPIAFDLITNCGPKSAVFTVRRFGSVSNALPVGLGLKGTATNGIDYTLVGGPIIPARASSIQIAIVPTDEAASNFLSKTVIMTILPRPDTLIWTPYLIGVPGRAEAIIYEGMPHPFPWLLADRSFRLNAPGPDGAWFVVQHSPDSLNWTVICTNQVVQGSIDFVDPDASTNSAGFYRALPQ